MIKPFLHILLLLSFSGNAQNLVPNGSFEEYSQCPEQNELNNGQFERCTGWSFCMSTPDYFNVCNNSVPGPNQGMVGVPENFWGKQSAFEGSAYIGLVLYDFSLDQEIVQDAEYPYVKLNSPLKPCTKYGISMRISLAEESSHGSAHIGIHLSKTPLVGFQLQELLGLEPNWESSEIISDTSNWSLLTGEFSVHGGESYLSIGNFFGYNESDTQFNDSNLIHVFNSYGTYFYLDSISIFEIESIESCLPEISNVFSPNGDQINDLFSINGMEIKELIILNRWGGQITVLNEFNPFWDGTSNGIPCSEGTYFYKAIFKEEEITGFIELIR